MLELPHVLVGSLLAVTFPPAISLPLSLASHFAFDLFPHWNPSLKTINRKTIIILTLDATLALAFGLYFYSITLSPYLLIACFLSVLPDIVEIPTIFFKSQNPYLKQLLSFQRKHQHNVPPLYGLASQFVLCLVVLLAIFSKISS